MVERIDRLSQTWDASPLLQLIAPVFCVAWEAMLFSRMVFLGAVAGANPSGNDQWQLLGILATGCCLLFVRHRWPLAVLGCELAIAVAASGLDWLSVMYLPPMVALYACVARGPWRVSLAGFGLYLLGMTLALAIDARVLVGPEGLSFLNLAAGEAISTAAISLVLAAVAFASHARWERRTEAAEEHRREAERAVEMERLAAARDAALAKSRIAAELHDSVGHNLTAIIALSEGLVGATGDEALDAALASINELARTGLADTRRAVQALASAHDAPQPTGNGSGTCTGNVLGSTERTYRWDEIPTLLDTARAAGITAALTETGCRAQDVCQADLAFRIVRESVTNALRHAPDLTRIMVSLDHGEDGGVTVTVRNDGADKKVSPQEGGTGMGLNRLGELVAASGGTLSAGLEEPGGWAVRAELKRACEDESD